uniref:Si:ch211-131k2.2 n=1 Tax=Hucho hucho TaxID=62062 RepID=A0A4W5Q487_9TELE
MDILKFQLVIVTLYTLVCTCRGLSFSVDKEHWVSKDWQDEPLEERLSSQVASLIKRSKARQFYGLMGKRSGNKGDMFVGLMGRRALSGGKNYYTSYKILCSSVGRAWLLQHGFNSRDHPYVKMYTRMTIKSVC